MDYAIYRTRRGAMKILTSYYRLLLQFHQRNTGRFTKFFSLLIGTIFFLVILPIILFLLSAWFGISWTLPPLVTDFLAVSSILVGLVVLCWATYSQLTRGGGTPAPNAPTQHLVITGPYRYSRNPIEFGALWYYFGVGVWFGSLFHGLICLLFGWIVGSVYHKFVEERELLLRFGHEYETYRNQTPFLIPKWPRK